MIFTDDVVLEDDNTNVLEGKLKHWREVYAKIKLKRNKKKSKILSLGFKMR